MSYDSTDICVRLQLGHGVRRHYACHAAARRLLDQSTIVIGDQAAKIITDDQHGIAIR